MNNKKNYFDLIKKLNSWQFNSLQDLELKETTVRTDSNAISSTSNRPTAYKMPAFKERKLKSKRRLNNPFDSSSSTSSELTSTNSYDGPAPEETIASSSNKIQWQETADTQKSPKPKWKTFSDSPWLFGPRKFLYTPTASKPCGTTARSLTK